MSLQINSYIIMLLLEQLGAIHLLLITSRKGSVGVFDFVAKGCGGFSEVLRPTLNFEGTTIRPPMTNFFSVINSNINFHY